MLVIVDGVGKVWEAERLPEGEVGVREGENVGLERVKEKTARFFHGFVKVKGELERGGGGGDKCGEMRREET